MDPEKIATFITLAPLVVYGIHAAYQSARETSITDARMRRRHRESLEYEPRQRYSFKVDKF